MADCVTIYFRLKDPDCGERLARQLGDPPRAWKISSHDGGIFSVTVAREDAHTTKTLFENCYGCEAVPTVKQAEGIIQAAFGRAGCYVTFAPHADFQRLDDGTVLVPTLDPLSIYCVYPDGTFSAWQGVFRKGDTDAA